MEVGNRLWKRTAVYGKGFVNNLTMVKISNIILTSILGEDFTLLVMRSLETGPHFYWFFYYCPFYNAYL
jgi:hypothetical protein